MARKGKAQSSSLAGSAVTGPLFSRVVGQRIVCSYLRRAIENQRVAHAYLFTGPAGVGKDAVALDFAAALLCEKFDQHAQEAPCRTCTQCRLALRLQHPDLHPIAPTPGKTSRGRSADEGEEGSVDEVVDKKLLEVFAKKAADPYVSVLLPRARDILISQIRVLTNQASRMPFQAARKVFVIFHADRMNVNAQNALLKVLEEPPADTHLLLTSEREGALLETIQSRCQHITFQPLSEADIEDALQSRHPEPGEAAPLVSRLAGGNLRQALEFSGMDWDALQNSAVDYLAACTRPDPIALEDCISKLLPPEYGGPPVRWDSAHHFMDLLKLFLGTLQLFLRDVALIQAARHARQDPQPLVVLRGFRDRAEKLVEGFPDADPERAVRAIQTTRDYLERGYSPSSVVTALSFRLHHALGPRKKSRRAA